MTKAQKQIILEIDTISKMKTVETFEERWKSYIEINRGPKRRSLSDFSLPNNRNKETLVIIGPGPSITQYADRLVELKDVATVCILPTALEWSAELGLYPDFVVIQDSGIGEVSFFSDEEYPVIGPTTIHPDVVKSRDPYLFTLTMGSGRLDDPMFGKWNERSLWIDSDLDGGVLSMGCVTNLAIEIIQLLRNSGVLRAKRIVLIGQDFAGWRGMARTPRLSDPSPISIESRMEVDWLEWNGYYTDPRMIWYKWKLLQLWFKTEAPLYSMSHGMLHELPFVFFEQVMGNKWPKHYPKQKAIEKMFEQYSELVADTFPREEEDG